MLGPAEALPHASEGLAAVECRRSRVKPPPPLMHAGQDYLGGLATLHHLASADERRSVWRQGVAALANAAADQQPTPLEGTPTESLLASVRVALATGLVDDLGWLSKPVAAAALFE